MYVSPSELMLIELIWYACAFAYTLRGTAATTVSWYVIRGRRKMGVPFAVVVGRDVDASGSGAESGGGDGGCPPESATDPLFSATTLTDFSNTFHSLIVLSARAQAHRTRQLPPLRHTSCQAGPVPRAVRADRASLAETGPADRAGRGLTVG